MKASRSATRRRPTFIRAWREHNRLPLQALVERLREEQEFMITAGQLSRIERGQHPYSQDLLEALSGIYGVEPAELLMRNPADDFDIVTLWGAIELNEKPRAMEMLKAFLRLDRFSRK